LEKQDPEKAKYNKARMMYLMIFILKNQQLIFFIKAPDWHIQT